MSLAATRDLGVSFAGSVALASVTFELAAGERLAVLGASGAGKSTLARSLAGLIPDLTPAEVTGSVTRPDALGFVPEDAAAALIEPRVGDDVGYGLPSEEAAERVVAALAAVGLEGFEERATGELSGGQVQRVAVAGALAREAGLIILDDPTSELDADGRRSVLDALADTTALITTHDPWVVERCDRVIVLAGGAVVFDGAPADLYSDPKRCRELGLRVPDAVGLRARLGVGPAATPGERVAEVAGLDFTYPGGVRALASAELSVARGEIVALRGANGSGKSTLARCLAGLLPAGPAVRVEGRVAMVFQNPDAQLFEPTVGAEVGFAARCQGCDQAEVAARVDAALRALGLQDEADVHPMRLTRSRRQLVAVASALAAKPDLLILDEPTAGLDAGAFDAVATTIAGAAVGGAGVVLITHDDELAGLATRLVTLTAPPPRPAAAAGPAPAASRPAWDPRVVGGVILGAVVALAVAPSWPWLVGLLAVGLVLLLSTAPGAVARLRAMLVPLLPLVVLIGVFGYLLPPTNVGDPAGYAASLALRLLAMLVFTVWGLAKFDTERAIAQARASRLPASLVLVVTIAMRFVPTLTARLEQIRQAQRSRGARFDGGPLRRGKALLTVLIPLFVGSIRTSNDLAAALTVRGVL